MQFDAREDDDPLRYAAFVDALKSKTSGALSNAGGNDVALHSAIRAFLEEGYAAGLTNGELTDFFCVDSPSILDQTTMTEPQLTQAVSIFDEINTKLINAKTRKVT